VMLFDCLDHNSQDATLKPEIERDLVHTKLQIMNISCKHIIQFQIEK